MGLRRSYCKLESHQRVGSDSADFVGLSGPIVARLFTGLSDTQYVPFVWKYQACYGTAAETKVMLWTLGSITQNDIGSPCPTLTPYTKTGVTRIDNGDLVLKFDDAYDGKDFESLRLFVGHMDLQFTLPTSSQAAPSSSSTGATSSSDSTISISTQNSSRRTFSTTSSITGAGNLTSIPLPNVSWTESPAETVARDPSVSNPRGSTVTSSNSNNNTGKIAGIAAGAGATCLLLLLAFLFFRRRRRRQQEIQKEERIHVQEIAPWTPHGAYPPAKRARVRTGKMNNRPASSNTITPPFQSTKSRPLIRDSSHGERVDMSPISGPTSANPSTVATAMPPSYDMHSHHQIVTPRVKVEKSEHSSVGDMSLMDEIKRMGRASSECHLV